VGTCGEQTKYNKKKKRYNKFLFGHDKNMPRSEESNQKRSKTMTARYAALKKSK